ncbi:ArsR/SmtB family transcription factor [Microbacterium sp. RD1]|uniref:ArsR/SmtB family transcription factor n=1 Tax=Microbacterium sp. RD1 TaxID=3457313 RepID=UPI003FA55D48
MAENRRRVADASTLAALAHPVRLDVLSFLMSAGPATASACARAVGDTPSNCSYHLRVLAGHGLVEPAPSTDGRERPWRATVTGLESDLDAADPDVAAGAAAVAAAELRLDFQRAREHLRTRDTLPPQWRGIEAHMTYGLRVTPEEVQALVGQIDALLRPFIAATRTDAPDGSAVVSVSTLAYPRPTFDHREH